VSQCYTAEIREVKLSYQKTMVEQIRLRRRLTTLDEKVNLHLEVFIGENWSLSTS